MPDLLFFLIVVCVKKDIEMGTTNDSSDSDASNSADSIAIDDGIDGVSSPVDSVPTAAPIGDEIVDLTTSPVDGTIIETTTNQVPINDAATTPAPYTAVETFTSLEETKIKMWFDNATRYQNDGENIFDRFDAVNGNETFVRRRSHNFNFGIDISYRTLNKLQSWRTTDTSRSSGRRQIEDNWLNSSLVNAYVNVLRAKNIRACAKDNTIPVCYMMDSGASEIMNNASRMNHDSGRQTSFFDRIIRNFCQPNHTQRKGLNHILNANIIFWPTNVADTHWILLATNVQQQQFNSYDSSYIPNARTALLTTLRRFQAYLCTYFKEKIGTDTAMVQLATSIGNNVENWAQNQRQCPRQTNHQDCAVFMCQTIHHIALNSSSARQARWLFDQADMPHLRCRMCLEITNCATQIDWMLGFQNCFDHYHLIHDLDLDNTDQFLGQLYSCSSDGDDVPATYYRVEWYDTNLELFVVKQGVQNEDSDRIDWVLHNHDDFMPVLKSKESILALLMAEEWKICHWTPTESFVMPASATLATGRLARRKQNRNNVGHQRLKQNYMPTQYKAFKPNKASDGSNAGSEDSWEYFGSAESDTPHYLKVVQKVKQGAGAHGLEDLVAKDTAVLDMVSCWRFLLLSITVLLMKHVI